MKIFIKAKPSSGQVKIEKIDDIHFTVWVKEPPAKGLANRGIIKALSDYFSVSQSEIQIVSGFTSRNKIIKIN
ncbi:MAG: DUF167 domain-containing protein [bacterium]